MKGVPQGRYTREFRQEAVGLVTEEKLSLPKAARRWCDMGNNHLRHKHLGLGWRLHRCGYPY